MQVPVVDKPSVDLGAISANGVLIPVMPLFDNSVTQALTIEEAAPAAEAEVAEVQLVAKLSNSEQLEKSPLMLIPDINSMLDGIACAACLCGCVCGCCLCVWLRVLP